MPHRPLVAIALSSFIVFIMSGCFTALSSGGARVRVIVGDPPNECVEVGQVDGVGAMEGHTGYESAKNDLREQAYRKHATHVRIEKDHKNNLGGTTVVGTAYRCPEPAPPAEID